MQNQQRSGPLAGCAFVLLSLELTGVGEALVTDLVERIGRVGNQLAKENLFV